MCTWYVCIVYVYLVKFPCSCGMQGRRSFLSFQPFTKNDEFHSPGHKARALQNLLFLSQHNYAYQVMLFGDGDNCAKTLRKLVKGPSTKSAQQAQIYYQWITDKNG